MQVDITPIGKPRITHQGRWKPNVRRWYDFANSLRLLMPKYQLTDSITVTFYLPMPKSWSQKKRAEMNGKPHQSKPDIDNLYKSFSDAFGEDKTVYRVVMSKYWSETGRIELNGTD